MSSSRRQRHNTELKDKQHYEEFEHCERGTDESATARDFNVESEQASVEPKQQERRDAAGTQQERRDGRTAGGWRANGGRPAKAGRSPDEGRTDAGRRARGWLAKGRRMAKAGRTPDGGRTDVEQDPPTRMRGWQELSASRTLGPRTEVKGHRQAATLA